MYNKQIYIDCSLNWINISDSVVGMSSHWHTLRTLSFNQNFNTRRGCCGCDHMIVGFTTSSVTYGRTDTLVSSTNKTDIHNITEILLKVASNTITLTLFILSLKAFEKKKKGIILVEKRNIMAWKNTILSPPWIVETFKYYHSKLFHI